jgi:hypothetical protein
MINLVLLLECLLIKDTGTLRVGVFNSDDTVAPPVFYDSVALAKEHLLSLHGVELLQLCLNVS